MMLAQPMAEPISTDTASAADPVLAALERFFAEHVPAAAPGAIPAEFALLESGLIDSLSMLQLTAFLSDAFGVTFTDEDFTEDNFATAGALARLVRTRQTGAG